MTKRLRSTRIDSVFLVLMTSQSVAEDVAKCIMLRNNCDARPWSNSLDIDFIPGHIHGR